MSPLQRANNTCTRHGLVWMALFVVGTACAEIVPLGGEIWVDSNETGVHGEPRVAMTGNGSFVVVWESDHQTGADDDIYARLYNGEGVPVNDEFRANETTADDQRDPEVVMNPDTGEFVVLWESRNQAGDTSSLDIYARLFDASGAPATGEVLINQTTDSQQKGVRAAIAEGTDDLLVAWLGLVDDEFDIFYGRFSLQLAPLTDETRVNTTESGDHFDAAIGADSSDNFVIVWEMDPGEHSEILLQRFDADGNPQGGEVLVNTTTDDHQNDPDIAMNDAGEYAVVWDSTHIGQSGIFAQIYDPSGTPSSGEFQVNETPAGNNPKVSMDNEGNIFVTWETIHDERDIILARAFNRAGEPLSADFVVHTENLEIQGGYPHIAHDPGQNLFVIVWEGFASGAPGGHILARLFRLAPGTGIWDASLY